MYTKQPEHQARDLSKLVKPAVSINLLIFSVNFNKFEVILIKRIRQPYEGLWSIPGDIISVDESLENAAKRVLQEKTAISDVYLEQLYTFGDVNRDPRGRVITVSYFALLPFNSIDLTKAPGALQAQWFDIDDLPKEMAFDHKKIVKYGVERLRNKVGYSDIAKSLLPKEFRLFELQKITEIILQKKLDKRNFRKKLASLNLVKDTGKVYKDGNHRPAKLYKYINRELIIFD